jgi:hypothetical protein
MTDRGIKKVIIPNNTLPSVTEDNRYLIRYRIVSEDRNRVSGWSPVFALDANSPSVLLDNDVTYSINNRIISIAWEDQESRNSYDIFVKFDNAASYSYHGTANSQSYTILSQGTESFQFVIQVSSMSKQRNTVIQLYESSVISLV